MLSQEAKVDELYDHLLTVVQNVDFLNMLGLGNEVPFFICPYRPEDETDINKITENLVKKLHEVGVHVLHINLYDLSIELMQKRGIWQRTLEKEPGIKKQKLQDLLSNVLDAEKHLVPAIAEKMKTDSNFQVMFLSGVGQIYPFIRTHNILNNLQSHAEDKPTVIFFPGKYKHSLEKGAALQLFSLLHDDKYYRAFNILEYSV